MITDPPAGHIKAGPPGGKPVAAQPETGDQAWEAGLSHRGADRWAGLDMRVKDLTELETDFPDFRIWCEITGERVRFVAQSLAAGTRPHTLVSPDLTELRAGLTDGERTASPRFDPARANIARMYSYLLGGKDHLASDRQAANEVLDAFPEVSLLARANRGFVTRAVRHVAAAGLSQFIDVGSGLPESPNVHETAQQVNPAARVAYVDRDPVVLSHARALLAGGPGVAVAGGDMRDPAAILASHELQQVIDLSEPVCLVLASVLHFVAPAEADAIVAAFVSAMAPGSFLVVSAGTSTGTDPALLTRLECAYAETTVVSSRAAEEIAGYFTGLDMEPPGLVDVGAWRPDHEWFWPAPPSARLIGAIGRKPNPQPSTSSRTPAPFSPRSAA